jgi:hypothetical protein
MVSTALALHPAERRRITALLPPEPNHDALLRPLGGGGGAALIVTARETSFLQALFTDLQADDWQARLNARRGIRRGADGVLELGLPTHRHFQIVLMEAVCAIPGFPRVDPAKLVAMGVLIRREETSGSISGWLKDGPTPRGWLPVAPGATNAAEPDPDPARRPAANDAVSRQLAVLLATRRGATTPAAEDIYPLFVAPPEVCAARGRTIVYGIVPVSSMDRVGTSGAPDFANLAADDDAAVLAHLSEYLKQRPALSMPLPGRPLDYAWQVLQPPDANSTLSADVRAAWPRLNAFGVLLQQLQVEFGAFDAGATGVALITELNKLRLNFPADAHGHARPYMNAGDFCRAAAAILIAGGANTTGLVMPSDWPAIGAAACDRLTNAAKACLTARFRDVVGDTPKFDRDERLYRTRAFARIAGYANCPPRLIWSPYSEHFRILPWWDSDAPPARVSLPPVLKTLRPNVSFELPPQLANLLQGDMKKLATGDGSPPGSVGIGWICSFSIPIITICAFIVLNIFLSLFDIVFFWKAFVKICIPYPKKNS